MIINRQCAVVLIPTTAMVLYIKAFGKLRQYNEPTENTSFSHIDEVVTLLERFLSLNVKYSGSENNLDYIEAMNLSLLSREGSQAYFQETGSIQ